MFKPWSSKTNMTQLSRESLGFKDCETVAMWAPSCGQVGPEGSEEIPQSVNSETMSINDVPQNACDGANDHFLKLIKGDGVLSLVECQWTQEDKNGRNTGCYSPLDLDEVEEINVYPVIDIEKLGGGSKSRMEVQCDGRLGSHITFAKEEASALPRE